MENDNELHGNGNSVDFGARMYNPRLGRWFSTDELEGKYTSYSPYHAMYDNPISVIDGDGRENIVIVGNQGGTPSSDKVSWKNKFNVFGSQFNKTYRYGKNKRHFLEAGFKQAIEYKVSGTVNDEITTMIVFEGSYTKDELDHYRKKAEDVGVEFLVMTSASEIKSYVNESGGKNQRLPYIPGKRGDDLITDFTYIGHGSNSQFMVGHNFDGTTLKGSDFGPNAFHSSCNANLLGCGNGLDIHKYFTDNLVGGNVMGYNTTVWWGADGLGSYEPHHQEYVPYGVERYSSDRLTLALSARINTAVGSAGKGGLVGGSKFGSGPPNASIKALKKVRIK